MPLSERASVEVCLTDLPRQSYRDLLDEIEQEFTYTFGGCTTLRALDGNYRSQTGFQIRDRINIVFTVPHFSSTSNSHYFLNMQINCAMLR